MIEAHAKQRVKDNSAQDIGIIGGGILGLTLGYFLSRDGHRVTLYERDESVGGLIRSIQIGDISMDRFYHVILAGDTHWLGLIDELGLGDRVYFTETKAGFHSNNRMYALSTISEYITFPLISLLDRFRLAFSLQYCKMKKDWHSLEKISIKDFLVSIGGKGLFEKFWKPLLAAKFDHEYDSIPMTYIWSRVRRMASTRRGVGYRESMGHIRGNLQIVVDTLEQKIIANGGKVRCGTSIESLWIEDERLHGVSVGRKHIPHDKVISTLPHPLYQRLLPESLRTKEQTKVEYMGIVCILLVLKEKLTQFHTINLADGTTPYTGIIETTNVIDPNLMGGKHLVYVPKYLSPKNKEWLSRSDEDLKQECFGHFKRIFPHFKESDVEAVWIGREPFVEPVYSLNFWKTIPPIHGAVNGLFVANNSQTYPFLLNCESVVSLANIVLKKVYHESQTT